MRFLLTSFLLSFITLSQAQSLFFNTYGTNEAEERAFDMVILDDGSIITAGDRYATSNAQRTGYLLKVDSDGNEQWGRQLTSNSFLFGTSICQLPNGNVFVAGYDYDVPNRNYGIVVAAYNASNGVPIYQTTHELDEDAEARDVIPMPDNGAIVLASYETASTVTCLLVRLNASGDTVWTRPVNPYPGNEEPRELALLSDGLMIVGSVRSGTTDNVFIVKTDLDGNIIWDQEYPSSGLEFGESIVENPSGGFYVAGTTNAIGNGGLDVLAMKVDATGQLIWANAYGRGGNELGYDVDVMPDGGAIFTGSLYKADTSNFRDLALIRTDAAGEVLWTRYFGDVYKETGHEVQVDGDYIVACGKADINNSENVAIVRADINGNAGVGINDSHNDPPFTIYPNPFVESVYLEWETNQTLPISIMISDLTGKVLWQSSVTNRASVNLAWLPPGTYLLSGFRNGHPFVSRLVKSE
jgi:hypothetical protein